LLVRDIQAQVALVDKAIPLSAPLTGNQLLGQWVGYLKYRTTLLASFAAMALIIAAIGVFGAISYSAAQRTREIGVRMALGAQGRDVLRLLISQGARLALVGLAIGVIVALGLARLMVGLIYGVTTSDPLTFVGVAALLVVVALIACYVPARRAMRVDPMVALRSE
jgi:putative ABC transport system permease protein